MEPLTASPDTKRTRTQPKETFKSTSAANEDTEQKQGLLRSIDGDDNTNILTLFMGTWNMHGKESPSESIECFLPVGEYDMYVVGTQECERSIEASVVFPSNKMEWEMKVRDTMGPDYEMVASHNFGALDLVVLIRTSLKNLISHVDTDAIATGFGNVLNNKGAVAVSMYVGNTSFLFINAHFAAFHDNVEARNEDFQSIRKRLFSGMGNLDNILGTEIVDHTPVTEVFDRVFWFGDLNYRINGDRSTVEKLIKNSKIELLIPHDQLTIAREEGQVFEDFLEGPLTFPPTYKFDTGTDFYDTSPKARIPAWTDRILWKRSDYIILNEYKSVPKLCFSDHKPVYATFEVKYSADEQEQRTPVTKKNRGKTLCEKICAPCNII